MTVCRYPEKICEDQYKFFEYDNYTRKKNLVICCRSAGQKCVRNPGQKTLKEVIGWF